MATTIEGKVPGFEYIIASGLCAVCRHDDVLVLRTNAAVAVCEACTTLFGWAWRQLDEAGAPALAFGTKPRFAMIVIVKEREGDYITPFDVLMVSRGDESKLAFGVPGGKIESGESPEEAAVRELEEETGLVTWPAALEPLYTGYSARSSLGRVFLCRAYSNVPDVQNDEGSLVEWKPWPSSHHTGHQTGLYLGLEEAFLARWKLHRQAAATTPLCLRLSRSARAYLMSKLDESSSSSLEVKGFDDAFEASERKKLLEAFSAVMSAEEKDIVDIVVACEQKRRGELMVKEVASPMPAANAAILELQQRIFAPKDGEKPEDGQQEDEIQESEENDEGERNDAGFVRSRGDVPRIPRKDER